MNATAFSHQAIQLIHIDENSGTSNEMLNKVAAIYQEEIDERYDRSASAWN
nr:hypothetical protein [Coxiella endosymbiont of Ornithodoros amblus]